MDFFNRIFKRHSTLTKTGLEEAKEKGLITDEEYLRLQEHRATQRLEDYLKAKKSKK